MPDQPGDSEAQKAFNAYLRTLTGFPASSAATASFSGPVDPTSVRTETPTTPGSLVIVDTSTGTVVSGDEVITSVNADGTGLAISSKTRWTPGHRYAVLLFGNNDAVAVRGAGGESVQSAPAFFFLSSPTPVLARCGDPTNPECICPSEAVADPNDTSCTTIARGLTLAQAKTIEPQRAMLDAALNLILGVVGSGHARSDLVLFWSFTITTQPMAVFDPGSGTVPFPNDALIDQTTGLAPRCPSPLAIRRQRSRSSINTLDGFSTSAALSAPVDLPAGDTIDASTLVDSKTVSLLKPWVSATSPPLPQKTVAVAPGNQIVLQPTNALAPDQRRYATIVTRLVKDAKGNALVPAPTTALILQPNPLVDATGKHRQCARRRSGQAARGPASGAGPAGGRAQQPAAPSRPARSARGDRRVVDLHDAVDRASAGRARCLSGHQAAAYRRGHPGLHELRQCAGAAGAYFLPINAVVEGTFQTQLIYDPKTRMVTFDRAPLPWFSPRCRSDDFSASRRRRRPSP